MQNKFITQIQKSLQLTGDFPEVLEDMKTVLKKSQQLRKFLESVFGEGSVVAAYDSGSKFTKGSWNMGCCKSVFITNTGKVIETSNSEWGDMSKRGKVFKREEKNV